MRCVILFALLYGVLGVPTGDNAFKEFVTGNRKFTASVYKEILKVEKGNFIVSPLSAEIVLALTNEGAKGDTVAELTAGLSLPSSKEKTRNAIQSLLPSLGKSDGSLKLLSANRIYTDKALELEEDFKSIATSVYDSGVENVDFSKQAEVTANINNWVENKTLHKITNLLKPEDIKDDSKVVLVNALYFSGKWVHPLEDYMTMKKPFFKTKSHSVEIDTMRQTNFFSYCENDVLDVKFLALPYKDADIHLVIVLPNDKEGLKNVEKNFEQLLVPQEFTRQMVDVQLPKFAIETEIKFVPILENLGIKKLFDNADLSGLSANIKNLHVSDVIQKAFINVTETGTEAAAATAAMVIYCVAYRCKNVQCGKNIPFYTIDGERALSFKSFEASSSDVPMSCQLIWEGGPNPLDPPRYVTV